ncbi:MAG TPA: LptF/LptG family permease [Caulobacteraceae bacterium]|jgi:lipopolysaccharide export system permease protein|nr:LptF/LptG family permease [Caulobacteraceae bacterium]
MASFGLSLIDSYMLQAMIPPMAAAFGVVLIALMLDRTLELFNLLAASSARFGLIVRLMGNLVPHYLGLALPAAYFISVFLVIARMSDTSEVDALLASGVSITRLTAPFVGVGAVIAAVSVLLLGYLQPYGRYGYNANLNAALFSGWDARLQPKTFILPREGAVLTADAADPAGRALHGVFVRWTTAEGLEQVVTAKTGRMQPTPNGRTLEVLLENGQQYRERADGQALVGGFDRLAINLPLAAETPRFRARGDVERELTLAELERRIHEGPTATARERAASELYIRLVRSISVPLLPLLAIPLGMAAKRGKRGFGVVVASVILLLYEHGIETGQSIADTAHVSPLLAVWTPFAIFTAICASLFLTSRKRPGDTPFNLVLDTLAAATSGVRDRIAPRKTSV